MIDDAMQEGQKIIAHAAAKPEIIDTAKHQATLLIQNIYLKLGWNISIQWQEQSFKAQ